MIEKKKGENKVELYDSIAKHYSLITRDKDWYAEAMSLQNYYYLFSSVYRPNNILDIGCGVGHHLKHLTPMWKLLHGIDASKDMLDLARENVSSKVQLYHMKLEECNELLPGKLYNMIMANYAIINHNLRLEKLDCFFKAVAAMLLPDGIFIFDYISRTASLADPPRDNTQVYDDGLLIKNTSDYNKEIGFLKLKKNILWQGNPFAKIEFSMTLWDKIIFDDLAKKYHLEEVGHFKQLTTEVANEETYKVTAIYKMKA